MATIDTDRDIILSIGWSK